MMLVERIRFPPINRKYDVQNFKKGVLFFIFVPNKSIFNLKFNLNIITINIMYFGLEPWRPRATASYPLFSRRPIRKEIFGASLEAISASSRK